MECANSIDGRMRNSHKIVILGLSVFNEKKSTERPDGAELRGISDRVRHEMDVACRLIAYNGGKIPKDAENLNTLIKTYGKIEKPGMALNKALEETLDSPNTWAQPIGHGRAITVDSKGPVPEIIGQSMWKAREDARVQRKRNIFAALFNEVPVPKLDNEQDCSVYTTKTWKPIFGKGRVTTTEKYREWRQRTEDWRAKMWSS